MRSKLLPLLPYVLALCVDFYLLPLLMGTPVRPCS